MNGRPAPAVWRSPEISAYFYNRAAARGQQVCINDRLGAKTRGQVGWGDFFTSEYHALRGLQQNPWEEDRSLSHSYGYNWEESFDDRYVLREDDALDLLLGVVANGGNLLLMVSPDGSGRIPPNQAKLSATSWASGWRHERRGGLCHASGWHRRAACLGLHYAQQGQV